MPNYSKSVTKEEIKKHEKFLKKYGILDLQEKPKRKRKIFSSTYSRSESGYKSLHTGFTPSQKTLKEKEEKMLISSMYEIGQAYNKSGFQVLTKRETSDSQTGKRR